MDNFVYMKAFPIKFKEGTQENMIASNFCWQLKG